MNTAAPTATSALLADLRRVVTGEVYEDSMRLGLYSTDASIYQQIPLAVCVPRAREEVAEIVRVARRHRAPVLGRGGGTSLAGQTTGRAVVVDFTKYLNRLLEVNEKERWARVEPGLARDTLNAAVAPRGLMFAPETSTSNRAVIGGMMANNSSGMMSIRYGRTSEHVLEVEAVLADGETVHFGPQSRPPRSERERRLREALLSLATQNRELIESRWPRLIRRVGGYSLDELLTPDPNFAKFLCGSEGTLALFTEIKVNLEPVPKAYATLAIHYNDFIASLETAPLIVRHNPLIVELFDRAVIEGARSHPGLRSLADFVVEDPEVILTVETTGETPEEAREKLERIAEDVRATGKAYAFVFARDAAERDRMSQLRKDGLGLVAKRIGDEKPISFIEDAAVPVERMADYFREMTELARRENVEFAVYGHASVGVVHFKPVLNLKKAEDLANLARMSERALALVKKFGGCWSGEHGDGIIRGALNDAFWGPAIMNLFRETKRIFDPENLLNPGKIFDTPPLTAVQRYGPDYHREWDARYFHFRAEGGFAGAVEMCNGVGQCRKVGQGVMCPSFMATRDEEASTRGRANALRLAMSGQLGPDAMTSEELHHVLDLCLECKGCAGECPNNVDMARMKSEFLAAYHERHGVTLRERVFAGNPQMARTFAGPLARLVNPVMKLSGGLTARALGIAPERSLPAFATQTFAEWFRRRAASKNGAAPGASAASTAPVVTLFLDCYVNYYEPEIGRWLTLALEALGARVETAEAGCCQRTRISKGFLAEARRDGERTLRRLLPWAERGATVVVCEPSCLSALRDDLPDLVSDEGVGRAVASAVASPEAALERLLEGRAEPLAFAPAAKDAPFLLHGHCHQKSLEGTGAVHRLMRKGGARLEEIPSGCCGMAGSFGYEAEHYELSKKIAEERLLPAIRQAPAGTRLVASGFSCRHQLAELAGRRAMHFTEAFARALLGRLDENDHGDA